MEVLERVKSGSASDIDTSRQSRLPGRLEALRTAIQNGTYQVDAGAIAAAMIAHTLATPRRPRSRSN